MLRREILLFEEGSGKDSSRFKLDTTAVRSWKAALLNEGSSWLILSRPMLSTVAETFDSLENLSTLLVVFFIRAFAIRMACHGGSVSPTDVEAYRVSPTLAI